MIVIDPKGDMGNRRLVKPAATDVAVIRYEVAWGLVTRLQPGPAASRERNLTGA